MGGIARGDFHGLEKSETKTDYLNMKSMVLSALETTTGCFRPVVLLLAILVCWTWSAQLSAQETAATDAKPAAEETASQPTGGQAKQESGSPAAGQQDASTSKNAESVPEEVESTLPGLVMLAIVIVLFVVPVLLGNYFGKRLRMPEHSWKFSVAIGTLAAAAVVVSQGEVKFGPDLSGGITLIYELQDTSAQAEQNGKNQSDARERSIAAKRQLVRQLIGALSERVDPSGTKEVTIREYGLGQIEIIIPKASQQELEFIERRIYTAGSLEFRITASPIFTENREIIELAKGLPPGENEVKLAGNKVAEWVAYDEEEFGPVDREDPRIVKRLAGKKPQALILTNDGLDVTGEYLKSSSAGFDEQGRPEVRFQFNQQGAFRFGQLTGKHLPNASGQKYYLGILLDKKLLSAPSINSKITSSGRITGSMGKEEVDFIVGILNAGSLPASLNKEPISRETISPTLGAETVEKGRRAIVFSIVAVMVFMAFYYRFAGIVACLALAANLLLILGLMVLFKAAFTLPGLAGLVLTIGMSVDANVLIFERIREERSRGAALRMAIRNGFSRATQTIIDANVTTLITAVVIYKIAPDNVKGFGVTLILGIVMSMYTAIFLSRIVFDVAERTHSVAKLGMRQIIRQTKFDFLGKQIAASSLSLLLIAIGLVAVVQRGNDLLNIDFTGGSSVTMVFNEDQKMSFGEVKEKLDQTVLAGENLSLVEVGDTHTRYTVSCVDQDVEEVQKILHDVFGDRLKTYLVQVEDIHSLPSQAKSASVRKKVRARFVNFQQEADPQDANAEKSNPSPAPGNSASGEAKSEKTPPTDAGGTPETSAETAAAEKAVLNGGDPFAGGTTAQLDFGVGGSSDKNDQDAGVSYETVKQLVEDAIAATGHGGIALAVSNPDYQPGSARRFPKWQVKLALPEDQARQVLDHLQASTNSRPVFPLANKIGGRVAGDMKTKAIAAIAISLLGIVAYIWVRFQHVVYGFAAVVALIHDVLITLGMIALSAYVVQSIPALANALMIEKFQISLPIVAAFLTIIGYSLNDTIVVFDRIREVKGKSPKLSTEMINGSINQTLSRTLLTSLTTLLSVVVLYAIGGDGIHGFAYALVVGVVVGTYSSIFIASPALLWMTQRSGSAAANTGARAA